MEVFEFHRCPSYLLPVGLKASLLPLLLLLPSPYTAGQQQYYAGLGDRGRQAPWFGRGREPNWGQWRWNSVKDLANAMRARNNQGTVIAQPELQQQQQQQMMQQAQPSSSSSAAAAAGAAVAPPPPVSAAGQFIGGLLPQRFAPGGLASRANAAAAALSAAVDGVSAALHLPVHSSGSQQGFATSSSSPVASSPPLVASPSAPQSPAAALPPPAQPVRTDISVVFSPKPMALNSSRAGAGGMVAPSIPRSPSRNPVENYQRLHGNVTYATNPVVYKDPQGQASHEVRRSISNYLGIGGEEKPANPMMSNSSSSGSIINSYKPSGVQYSGAPSPGAPAFEQAATDRVEETGERGETEGRASTLTERRTVNPYDLSHIFPDIYANTEEPSTESLMHQSLPLLEMTVV
ncbi:hypothetical protein ACSSS7_000912 [Eimeria intestinalis]